MAADKVKGIVMERRIYRHLIHPYQTPLRPAGDCFEHEKNENAKN